MKDSKQETNEQLETLVGVASHEALKAAASHIKAGNTVCARMLLIAARYLGELLPDQARKELERMEILCAKFEETGRNASDQETAKSNLEFLNTVWGEEIENTINSARGSACFQRALSAALVEMVWGMYLEYGMFDELAASLVKVRKRSQYLFAGAYRELVKGKPSSLIEEAGERYLAAKALFEDLLKANATLGCPTEMEKLFGDPRNPGSGNGRQGKGAYVVVQRQKYVI